MNARGIGQCRRADRRGSEVERGRMIAAALRADRDDVDRGSRGVGAAIPGLPAEREATSSNRS